MYKLVPVVLILRSVLLALVLLVLLEPQVARTKPYICTL